MEGFPKFDHDLIFLRAYGPICLEDWGIQNDALGSARRALLYRRFISTVWMYTLHRETHHIPHVSLSLANGVHHPLSPKQGLTNR